MSRTGLWLSSNRQSAAVTVLIIVLSCYKHSVLTYLAVVRISL